VPQKGDWFSLASSSEAFFERAAIAYCVDFSKKRGLILVVSNNSSRFYGSQAVTSSLVIERRRETWFTPLMMVPLGASQAGSGNFFFPHRLDRFCLGQLR